MSRNEISAVDLSKIKNYSERKIVDLDLSFQNESLREFLSTFTIEKKKVAIINMPLKDPETIRPELVKEKAYSLYPPLGPLYISSAIEENTDWQTDLFDIQKEIFLSTESSPSQNLRKLTICFSPSCLTIRSAVPSFSRVS